MSGSLTAPHAWPCCALCNKAAHHMHHLKLQKLRLLDAGTSPTIDHGKTTHGTTSFEAQTTFHILPSSALEQKKWHSPRPPQMHEIDSAPAESCANLQSAIWMPLGCASLPQALHPEIDSLKVSHVPRLCIFHQTWNPGKQLKHQK